MFEDFDLSNVLARPTQQRPEVQTETGSEVDLSSLEFEPIPQVHQEETSFHEKEEEMINISPYDAEENAEILVDLIDIANIQTLTPLAGWKLRKKLGGKNEVTKMQLLFEKRINNEELTDDEKRQIETYQAYLKDKEELTGAIPYTKDEKDSLRQAAIPYLKQHEIKVGGGLAFWTQLGMIQGSRILQVLTA